MSLKQLINALFKLSGGQAMPFGQAGSTTQTETNANNLSTTAPYDGYVVARFTASSPVSVRIYRDRRAVQGAETQSQSSNIVMDMSFPVKKGQAVSAWAGNSNTSIQVWFEYLVGNH